MAIENSCQETAKVRAANLRILKLVSLSCGLVAGMSMQTVISEIFYNHSGSKEEKNRLHQANHGGTMKNAWTCKRRGRDFSIILVPTTY